MIHTGHLGEKAEYPQVILNNFLHPVKFSAALFSTALLVIPAHAALTVFSDDFEYSGVGENDFTQGASSGFGSVWTAFGDVILTTPGPGLAGTFNPSGAAVTSNGWYDGITAFTDTEPSGGVVGSGSGPEFGFIFGTGNTGGGIQRNVGTIESNTRYDATIAISGGRVNGDIPETYSIDLISIDLANNFTILDTLTENSAGLLFENRSIEFDSSTLPSVVGETLAFRISVDGTDDENGYLDFDNLVLSETAIPEPSAALLLALGGFGLFLRRKRD